jgi:hypothetical protein
MQFSHDQLKKLQSILDGIPSHRPPPRDAAATPDLPQRPTPRSLGTPVGQATNLGEPRPAPRRTEPRPLPQKGNQMTREQLQALDRILRTIPDHRRRRPTHFAAADDGPERTHGGQAAINHPPVGGMRGLREYQMMLDDHYARLRAGERKPPPADPVAGLRDGIGFAA